MAAVRTDRFDVPSGTHDERVLAWTHALALDTLAGRTVWCVAALPAGRAAAGRLRALLREEVAVRTLAVAATEPLAALARRLDAMLAGTVPNPPPLDAAAYDAYARGAAGAEALIDRTVAPGDVVVLHDALTVTLARAVRERGAHAIWHVHAARGAQPSGARAAHAFLDPYTDAVDAFVVTWTEPRERRRRVEHVAALLPAAGLVAVKDATAGSGESAPAQHGALAWSSVLGDVVEADRDDRVGGTLHVRPAVAPR
ncbi:MAG TPA: hypothetical protein VFS37_07690 [Conexibacter sp.]|nr:hypothetical protein [Conexibacter sp.]